METTTINTKIKPFREITADQWDEALGCMPPARWHDVSQRFNGFFSCEPYSGNFHACYIFDRKTKKYYEGRKSIHATDAELLRDVHAEIINPHTSAPEMIEVLLKIRSAWVSTNDANKVQMAKAMQQANELIRKYQG